MCKCLFYMILPLFLFSIFKNLKETIEIVVKKFFKKYIKKILLWKNWIHIKKKKLYGRGGFWTHRPLIQSPALYQLSHLGCIKIWARFIDYILKKQPKLDSQDKLLIISKTVLNFFKSFSGIVLATSTVEWTPSVECGHEIFKIIFLFVYKTVSGT